MLKNEYNISRSIIVHLLKQYGYYDEWYEGDLVNVPIPHYLSIYSNKANKLKLEKILNNIIVVNKFEVAYYLQLKSQYIGEMFDNDYLKFKKIQDFFFLDNETLCQYICDFEQTMIFNYQRNSIENQKQITMRFEGYTLESIGQEVSLTRERVRQIVLKYVSTLDRVIENLYHFYFERKTFVTADLEIIDFNDENKNHILAYLNHSDLFHKINILGIYIFKDANEYNRIKNLTNNFLSASSFSNQEIDEFLSDLSVGVSRETITDYLILSKFYYFNGKYIKYPRYADYLLEIICLEFPSGIELRQLDRTNDFDKLVELAKGYFPKITFVDEPRAVYARLSSDMISIDRSLYMPKSRIDSLKYNINYILDYLDTSDSRIHYFSELFSRFRVDLKLSNVSNWYFLRELIKLNNSGEASYTRDYIEIERNIGSGLLKERIEEHVRNSSGPVTSKEITTMFSNFSSIMIYSATSQNPSIKRWGKDSWLSFDKYDKLPISKRIYEYAFKILEIDTYVSYERLFFELSSSNKLSESYIFSSDNLSEYLKNIYPQEFKFFDEGVSLLDRNLSDNIVERVTQLLCSYPKWNYHDFQILMNSQRFKESMINSVYRGLNESSIRIDRDNYILKSSFLFNQEIISQIEDEIELIFNEVDEHISPHYLLKNGHLPYTLDFSWNWYIFTSLLNTYGVKYKVILPIPSDRRFQDGMIVRRNSNLPISDTLVKHFVELGILKFSEIELRKYLRDRKLAENIPYEFYQNDSIDFSQGYFLLGKL